MDAIVFPDRLLVESSEAWNIGASTFSPGQTGSGTFLPPGRIDGGGLWVMSADLIVPQEKDDFLCYRAVRMLNQGGARPMVMLRDEASAGFPPWPVIGGVEITGYAAIPHSDGTLFSDGTGYSQPAIVAQTVGAAALRDTTLTINLISASALRGGEVFSLYTANQGWRMHEITTVVIDGNGHSVVTFEPPLRDDIDDATPVEFDRPRCVMFCATPKALDLVVTTSPYCTPSISFIEYPW